MVDVVLLSRGIATVILRLEEWANEGCVKDTQSPDANLILWIIILYEMNIYQHISRLKYKYIFAIFIVI